MNKTYTYTRADTLSDGYMFVVNGSNVIYESSTSCRNHLSVVSILQVWRSCHYLINIYYYYSFIIL